MSIVVPQAIGISLRNNLVPIGIREGLVEILTRTLTGENSKGLIIRQIQATTPKMVAKIVSGSLTVTGQGCDLKLDILEVVEYITESRKNYCWAQYLADMIKSICEKCQETGAIIKFPSLIIWIAMYHLCLVGHP